MATKHSSAAITDASPVPQDSIVLGDALEILPTLKHGSIDLTVFSPPYDGIRDYGKNWNLDYKSLGSRLFEVTKDGGVCCMVIANGSSSHA